MLLLWFCLTVSLTYAQTTSTKSLKLDDKSVVKDADGNIYPYLIWQKLVQTGQYNVKSISGLDGNEFLLYKLAEEEIAARKKKRAELVSTMPRPRTSDNFREGEKFRFEKMKYIDGMKHDFKTDTGKVVVFNFWFINCPPCKQEIPELNELVEKYKQNKDVVFIAIALDDNYALRDFLRAMPFNYNIIGDGRYYAQKYGVKSYPTHVIVGKDGLIKFSTVGLAANTIHWVDKTIKEVL